MPEMQAAGPSFFSFGLLLEIFDFLGLYKDDGKDNGNYYSIFGDIGILEGLHGGHIAAKN